MRGVAAATAPGGRVARESRIMARQIEASAQPQHIVIEAPDCH